MRKKLTLSFFLVVLVSFIGVIILSRLGVASEVRTFVQTGGQQHTKEVARDLEAFYALNGSWEDAETLLVKPMGQGAGRLGQGNGPGGAAGGFNQNLILADNDRKVLAATPGTDITIGEILPESSAANGIPLYSSIKSNNRKEIVGYLFIYNALRFGSNEESVLVERLSLAALIAGGVAGFVALLLGLYLTYRLLQPVRQLTFAARGLADGDLSQRVPVSESAKNSDELDQLARTFNGMADSLQRAQLARQAMTADIAHELRTPLSVQRATLEALQDGIYPLDTDSLIPLLEQNHLLSRLVEDLRTLALTDAGQLHLELAPTDLIEFVRRVSARFQAAADANKVALLMDFPTENLDCTALVDPLRMEQVLNNLLSNALRHTPPNGRIIMRVSAPVPGKKAYSIQIEDNGEGIPEEALPHIFDRFYRSDKSRSRQQGGSGLGLTIARDLMRAHGGDLIANNLSSGGAQFTIFIPAR